MAFDQTSGENMYEVPQAGLSISNLREASPKKAQEKRSTKELLKNTRLTKTIAIAFGLLILIMLALLIASFSMVIELRNDWKQGWTSVKDQLNTLDRDYESYANRTRKEFDDMHHLLRDSRQNATNGLKISEAYLMDLIQQSNNISRNQTHHTSEKLTKLLTDFASSVMIAMKWNKSENNYYYKKFSETVNYTTAEDRCKKFGARLAAQVLRDPMVVRNIPSSVYPYNPHTLLVTGLPWIGFFDPLRNGNWRWVDGGTASAFTLRWQPGKPDNVGGDEYCGQLYFITNQKFEVNDIPCNSSLPYICEKKIPDEDFML